MQGTVGWHACNFGGRGQRDARRRERVTEGIDVANARERKRKRKKLGREREIRNFISMGEGECSNNERNGVQ